MKAAFIVGILGRCGHDRRRQAVKASHPPASPWRLTAHSSQLPSLQLEARGLKLHPMAHLVVIYGAPLSGKTSLARELADALDDKASIVSVDALLDEAIRVHDRDAAAELDMVYTQARLLVANYLKNRYHVVLEGAFVHDRAGVLHHHQQEIDQTLGLMRNLAPSPLTVYLSAPDATLAQRVQASERPRDLAAVLRVSGAYRPSGGARSLELATDERGTSDLVSDVLARLTSAWV